MARPIQKCTVPGCTDRVKGHGKCVAHYFRSMRAEKAGIQDADITTTRKPGPIPQYLRASANKDAQD